MAGACSLAVVQNATMAARVVPENPAFVTLSERRCGSERSDSYRPTPSFWLHVRDSPTRPRTMRPI